MKNDTNIYDIDGEILRKAGDNEKMTLEEAENRIKKYKEKLEELDENDPKAAIYTDYIKNLNGYIIQLYSTTNKQDFIDKINKISQEEQVKKALEDLENDIENDGKTEGNTNNEIQGQTPGDNSSNADKELGNDEAIERSNSDVYEEGPKAQSDLLVERESVNTVMDEYVPYEEV